MKQAKLTILDECNVKFDGLDVATRNKIYKELEYFVPYAQHLPSYKLGRWDGKVSFANRGGKTAVNLLDRVLPIVLEANYELDVDDRRIPFTFEFPEVTEDMFSHITWPKGHTCEGQPIIFRDYQVKVIRTFLENLQCLQEVATGAGKCRTYDSTMVIEVDNADFASFLLDKYKK